ncbi:MAG: PAS domain-containing protein [Syntrophobacteraceae bacterium]
MLESMHELYVRRTELERRNEELQRALEQYEDLYKSSPCGYVTLNRNGIVTECNPFVWTLLGTEKARIKGAVFSSFVAPEWGADLWAALQQAEKTGVKRSIELKLIDADNKTLWVFAHIHAIQTESKEESRWRLAFVEIPPHKQAKHALPQRRKYRRAVLETTSDGFVVVDSEGKILGISDACCRLFGYSRAEILALYISDLYAYKKPAEAAIYIGRLMEEGTEIFETRCRRKDGIILDIEVSGTYLQMDGGQFVLCFHDITKRAQAENELDEYLGHLEELVIKLTYERISVNEQLNKARRGRQKAEQELRELREMLQLVLDTSPARFF